MAVQHLKNGIDQLRSGAWLDGSAGRSDGQLLERYLAERDAAALASLIRRHADMVWGVCRRLLPNLHDAEDAFQATFLVLVRRAACVSPRALVGNWLYGVACQTALKARSRTFQRRTREKQVSQMPEPQSAEQALWSDLQPLLDRELGRLPERQRAVILLCDLEGKTRKEAARQLGVPEGTVAGWLARARTTLAKRLIRHGLGLSGGTLATLLAENAAVGAPAPIVASTVKAAGLFALEPAVAAGCISTSAAALADGVVKLMLLKKLKAVASVMLIAGLLAASATFAAYRAAAETPLAQAEAPKPENKIQPADDAKAKMDALAGRWLLTLPAGFRYVATLRPLGGNRYELERGVRFGGGYELRDKQLVLTRPQGAEDAGFVWESRGPGEFGLVGQPPVQRTGVDYLGATLHRFADAAPKPDGPPGPAWQDRARIRGHQGQATCAELSPDGKTLITFDPARSELKFWDASTWTPRAVQPLAQVFTGGGACTTGAFAPDGKTVLAVGETVGDDDRLGRAVALFDAPSGKLRAVLPGGLATFSPDAKLLAVGSAGAVKLYDVATAKERATLKIDGDWREGKAAWHHLWLSPDSRTLATSRDRVVKLWDTAAGKERATLPGYLPALSAETSPFAPDSQTVVTVELDRTVRLWDVATGLERRPNRKGAQPVDPARLARLIRDLDSDNFGVREEAVQELDKLGDAAEGALRGALKSGSSLEVRRRVEALLAKLAGPGLRGHELPFVGAVFSPDGKTLATLGGHDGAAAGTSTPPRPKLRQAHAVDIKLWNIATGVSQGPLWGAALEGSRARFSPDGTTLAYLATMPGNHRMGCLVLWDLATHKARALIPSSDLGRFSSDGKMLMTQGPRDVTFFDVATGKPLASLATSGNRRLSFASLSRDWRVLVTSALADAKQPDAEITAWEFSDRLRK